MAEIKEKIHGIVERVTYHNPENGWSVLRVSPFNNPASLETVTVHQMKVFAGATMSFFGAWTHHSQFGRQFKAERAIEEKPATSAALEKYLGSGLIKGVGPKTARKIVNHFKENTLELFEHDIGRLIEVDGIAKKKLLTIEAAWREHRAIREVMMFLQGHGISTLFAVRIYKKYGEEAIEKVVADPYRLASDFYGIGFFSADKVALSIGLAEDSEQRIIAAIRHVLAAAREEGHCFLTREQIAAGIDKLLNIELDDRLLLLLDKMELDNQLKLRVLEIGGVETAASLLITGLHLPGSTAVTVGSFLVSVVLATSPSKVVINQSLYEVHFAYDNSYYTHCYHDILYSYDSGGHLMDTTKSYHQAVGG